MNKEKTGILYPPQQFYFVADGRQARLENVRYIRADLCHEIIEALEYARGRLFNALISEGFSLEAAKKGCEKIDAALKNSKDFSL